MMISRNEFNLDYDERWKLSIKICGGEILLICDVLVNVI